MIVGLTGHQKIGSEETVQWVEEQLSALLVSHRVTEGCMSLAIGADQMYARLLLDQGVPYRVVIPCERYAETFSGEDREKYFYLLSKARSVVALEFVKPSEQAFYEAGKQVVRASEMLIAVWDGLAARGLGGTADIVNFALSNSKRVLHLDTLTHAVRAI
jgi:hypothetical protein